LKKNEDFEENHILMFMGVINSDKIYLYKHFQTKVLVHMIRFAKHYTPTSFLLSSILVASNVNACPELDDTLEPKLSYQITKLCRSEFELGYSTEKKITLWAGEKLTAIEARDTEPRMSLFKADPELEKGQRAELYDYTNSGFDRGHMVPTGDMHTLEGMTDSFLLSNMMPQKPSNNRGIWKVLEKFAKDTAKSHGEVIIFTGPVLSKTTLTIGPNRIPVPRAMYKVIFDPKSSESWSFIVPNEKISSSLLPRKLVKLKDIKDETGIEFLKGMQVKEQTSLSN
jgi:endonuclease G